MAISSTDLTKRFGSTTALDGLEFRVEEGEIFGFLGPNGAGKTTAIDVLLDFVRPTSGCASVLGHDCQDESEAVRARTGVLPDGADAYGRLTGREHLQYRIRSESATDDPEALLERVGIADAADRRAGEYSRGMTQRLLLAQALVGEPAVLILDEPSTGLDPNGIRRVREIVRAENERGATVLFSSHSLDQVEALCDRVGILRAGEMVTVAPVDELRATVGSGRVLRVDLAGDPDDAASLVDDLDGVDRVETDPGSRSIAVHAPDAVHADVLDALRVADHEVERFSTEEPSLEEVFEAYTDEGGVSDGGPEVGS